MFFATARRFWRAFRALPAAEKRGYLWTFHPSFCDGTGAPIKTYVLTLRRESLDCVDAAHGSEVFVRAKCVKPFTGRTPLEVLERAAAWLEQDAVHTDGVLDKALDWVDGKIPARAPSFFDYLFFGCICVAIPFAVVILISTFISWWRAS